MFDDDADDDDTLVFGTDALFLVIFTFWETIGNQTDSIIFFSPGDPRRAGSSNRVVSMNISRAPAVLATKLVFFEPPPQAKCTRVNRVVQHFHA